MEGVSIGLAVETVGEVVVADVGLGAPVGLPIWNAEVGIGEDKEAQVSNGYH